MFSASAGLMNCTVCPAGSFAAQVPPVSTFYRAVYRDPTTGIPYAALLRSPAGAAGDGANVLRRAE